MVIRTQSHKSKGFNELRFEDATGEEQAGSSSKKTSTYWPSTTAAKRSSAIIIPGIGGQHYII
jgi:uncharacterized protein involved in type VI secretion and phage assembly|tara:strand:+ start:1133 stop:1321 length:189 start_codon:yes stop_codon:yes gene_type:complete